MTQKAHVACNFNCLFENEGLLRSQPFTHSVNVVISRKLCKMDWRSRCYYRPLIGS